MDLYDGVGDGHGVDIYIKNSGRVWGGIQACNPEHRIPRQQEQTGSHQGMRKGIPTQERPAVNNQDCCSLVYPGGSVSRSPDELQSFIPWFLKCIECGTSWQSSG